MVSKFNRLHLNIDYHISNNSLRFREITFALHLTIPKKIFLSTVKFTLNEDNTNLICIEIKLKRMKDLF